MGFMNVIFKFSAVIAIVGISLSYTDLGKHVVKTIHRLTPDWLNPHAKKSTSPSDDLEVYKVISDDGDRLFSKEELAKYVGDDEIYLAILGRVYDVTAGKDFYARGEGTYGFFTGKDGTRAYMTGEFNETGLIEDTTGLTLTQMTELEKWIEFYDNKYTYKGKLHGLYYDENGKPTQELFKVRDRMLDAKKVKKAADLERQRFPPCNQEWNQQTTARVWCTEKSGGVTRDWVGVPRKYFPPGAKQEQCVCVRTKGPPSDNPTGTTDVGDLENPHLRLYKGCDAASFSCALLD